MSSWSHFQKAGYMIGDEAYAGSRNFIHLQRAAFENLGIDVYWGGVQQFVTELHTRFVELTGRG